MLASLAPLVVLAFVEGALRLFWPAGAIPAFDRVAVNGVTYLTPSRGVGRRYFVGESTPPAPPNDIFAATRPTRGIRLFVLGESSAAGFPYPHNGTFSRVLQDALRDALPNDSVEVVNFGIAATNSYTIVDLAPSVVAQRPDAVLIYAGHNEYYGALGVGSSIRAGSSPRVVRAYLAAERLRIFVALRATVEVIARSGRSAPTDSAVATFMETIARNQEIRLDGAAYTAGMDQLHDNMARAVRTFRRAGIRVYLASIESNLRTQHPFVSAANGPAIAAFDSGQTALLHGDTATAKRLLVAARDLDVVRFRAPSAANEVLRRVASEDGARYVPAAEHLDSLSPGGIPGADLFLEHVHPTARGYLEIGRIFFDALAADGFLGHSADRSRVAPWEEYGRRMALTPFDDRIVAHTVRTVTTRWPFVARDRAQDYRGTYSAHGILDSLALLVSRGGMSWSEGKLRLATSYEGAGHRDSALAEYRGLVRDAPYRELPNRLAGRALVAMGRPVEALRFLRQAMRSQPSAESAYLAGLASLQRNDIDAAIALLDQAVRMEPTAAEPVYRLSLAFGLSRNLGAARATAAQAARLDPRLPGLAEWMRTLGMAPR